MTLPSSGELATKEKLGKAKNDEQTNEAKG